MARKPLSSKGELARLLGESNRTEKDVEDAWRKIMNRDPTDRDRAPQVSWSGRNPDLAPCGCSSAGPNPEFQPCGHHRDLGPVTSYQLRRRRAVEVRDRRAVTHSNLSELISEHKTREEAMEALREIEAKERYGTDTWDQFFIRAERRQ